MRSWLKFNNPAAPAVKREAEEDWNKMTERRGATATRSEAKKLAARRTARMLVGLRGRVAPV
jgi:hypothetical protein